MDYPTHPSFPDLTEMEIGVIWHIVGCPSENTVERLYRWSTFDRSRLGSSASEEDRDRRRRRNCERAFAGCVEKGYVDVDGLTTQGFLWVDWVTATRRHSNRVVNPEDLRRYVLRNPRYRPSPYGGEIESITINALSHNDAVDVAIDRLAGRGYRSDDFRSHLIWDAKIDIPLDRDEARRDLSNVTSEERDSLPIDFLADIGDPEIPIIFNF